MERSRRVHRAARREREDLHRKTTRRLETHAAVVENAPALDATHDWSGLDAVALLDELAAVQDTPIEMALDNEIGAHHSHRGMPLPPELAKAPWGAALPNGLRMAWLLEPRTAEYRLGTPLESRILIHNAGQERRSCSARGHGISRQPQGDRCKGRGHQDGIDGVDDHRAARPVPARAGRIRRGERHRHRHRREQK